VTAESLISPVSLLVSIFVVYCQTQIRLFESLDKLPNPDNHADKIIHDVVTVERASLK